MQLEYLKVGRNYRVKQGRKLLVLRLKEIQRTEGVGTPLYECKITTTGIQLWMLDEHLGKGYTIKNLSQIESEIPEKPVENSLVQIVKGVLLKSLGSVTVYRVKSVGIDEDTNRKTVTLYGPFKNYVCWMDDVRVYEGNKVDPETLLSKESKKIGEQPRRFLPGPAVPAKTKLTAFLKPPTAFGSLTGEEKKTKEDEEKERLQAELDKKKEGLEEYADLQDPSKNKKMSAKELRDAADGIIKRGKKWEPEQKTQDDESSELTGDRDQALAVSSSSRTATRSSTGNTASPQSSQKPAKSTTGINRKGKPVQAHRNNLSGLESRQPKARKEKLAQAIKKNSNLRVAGRNKKTEAKMPALKKEESSLEEDERPAPTVGRTGGTAVIVTPMSSDSQNTVPQTERGISIDEELDRLTAEEDWDNEAIYDLLPSSKPMPVETPQHLQGLSVPVDGLQIAPPYWGYVKNWREEKGIPPEGAKIGKRGKK